ncbi:hypothetical protein Mesil_3365 (plasmid) [Allomeiothermus silvanus DSM 9946]|uniref:Sensory transduction regulator n=1 Tax=Allomeiothermus silvanus (strain ATCC 700542 / DSM 9946 / NBRC 106475 / NCIMB 13440 / VI-R2) TaxID=526227 RepID=D7BJ21_ALLS1|nr:YbjN domain-containing protein [Allomeiothermus silvanus]ADH65177.1 hypothetical protein Mesil_3365 [Allomeiothermus silvanus DSM 9946]
MILNQVQPFNRSMLQEVLDTFDLHYLVDKDGDFVVLMRQEGLSGLAILHFVVSGVQGEVFSIVAQVENLPPFPEQELLEKANAWNAGYRWPRAFVKGGRVYLDFHLDLEAGIHPGLLRDMVGRVVAGVGQFVAWMEGKDLGGLFLQLLGSFNSAEESLEC